MRRFLSLLLTWLLALAPAALAQDAFGSIEGTAAPGQRVTLRGTSFAATADARGRFEITLVPAGVYELDGREVRVWTGTSSWTFTGHDIRNQSVDDPRAALTAAPGVMLRLGSIGVVRHVPLIIRGDRGGQPAVWLDGAPIRFRTTGETRPMSARGLEEISVMTGGTGVVHGDNRGGVIGYVSRIGGNRFRGAVHAESDQPFGSGLGVGYNRLEAEAGGPIGRSNARWFLAASLQGQGSSYRGAGAADEPAFGLAGIDTIVVSAPAGGPRTDTLYAFDEAGIRQPFDWSTLRTLHGRLLYSFGRGASLSMTVRTSDLVERFYPGTSLLARSLRRGATAASRLVVLNWGQPLGGTLSLQANVSLASERDEAGPLTATSESGSRDPALGIHLGGLEFTGMDRVPEIDDAWLKRLHINLGPFVPYQDSNALGNSSAGRFNPYGVTGWLTGGLNTGIRRVSEHRLTSRWQLNWRPRAAHRVTVGADLDRASLSLYEANLLSVIDLNAFSETPQRLGLFAAGHLNLGDVQLEVGVRADRFSGAGLYPVSPGRIFTNPEWTPDTTAAGYAANLGRVFTDSPARMYLSPRLAATYALSPITSLRVAVRRRVDAPSWAELFARKNGDLSFMSGSAAFGRDIEFASSTMMELGYRRASEALIVDVAAYHNTLTRYLSTFVSLFDPFRQENTSRLLLTDQETAASGVDLGLTWRPGSSWSGSLAYSLSRFDQDGVKDELDHAVHARASVRLPANLDAMLTLRVMTNAYYTRVQDNGFGILAPNNVFAGAAQPIEPINASRLPLVKLLDLRLRRGFSTGGRHIEVFADVRNLLNTRNLAALFAETGSEENAAHRDQVLFPQRANLRNDAGSFLQPDLSIDLQHDCTGWIRPADCVALQATERRYGNGDGLFTVSEQDNAFNAFYDAIFGPSRLRLPGRTIRIGFEIR